MVDAPGFDLGTTDGSGPPLDGDVNGDAGLDAAPPLPPPSGYTDPACTDGMYTETLPPVGAYIADLMFTGDISAYVDAFLDRRYPVGAALVRGGRTNNDFGRPCDLLFAGNPLNEEDLLRRMSTIVHECGHLYDGELSAQASNTYAVTATLQLTCERGDATDRNGDTFARSRIQGDEYASLRAPCPEGSSGRGCDFYRNIYLDGDPDDAMFQGGDQGFNLLLEEAFQYVNSLASEWATNNQRPAGFATSGKDGILTFLWYIERYLRMARLQFPGAYERLSGDPCWRNAILTLWGRAWLYLEATKDVAGLALDEEALVQLVSAPELLEEIERIRMADGC